MTVGLSAWFLKYYYHWFTSQLDLFISDPEIHECMQNKRTPPSSAIYLSTMTLAPELVLSSPHLFTGTNGCMNGG
jgi:hypothetical protein